MNFNKLLLALITPIMLLSCQKTLDFAPGTINPPLVAKTTLNVSYGSHSLQKMDIYLPANRNTTNTKVMVLIHGGGWNAGDKTELTTYVDSLQRRLPDYA